MHLLHGLQARHADVVGKTVETACRTRSHYEHENIALVARHGRQGFMAGRRGVNWLQGLTRGMSVLGEASMSEELALSLL